MISLVIRKQTIANGETYITPEHKELEEKVLGAHDKILAIEAKLFENVRAQISAQVERVQATANAVAAIDVLHPLAAVEVSRPEVAVLQRQSGDGDVLGVRNIHQAGTLLVLVGALGVPPAPQPEGLPGSC